MTHEELLSKINAEYQGEYGDSISWKILRAVVELHSVQPTTIPGDPKCDACSGLDWCDWPCQTIQVIQKELQ